jgi:hypothetical protein
LIDEIIEINIRVFVPPKITHGFFRLLFIFLLSFIDWLLYSILLSLEALELFILRLKFICLLSLTLMLHLFELFVLFNKFIKLNSKTLGLPTVQCFFCSYYSHWSLWDFSIVIFNQMLFRLDCHISLDEFLVWCKT